MAIRTRTRQKPTRNSRHDRGGGQPARFVGNESSMSLLMARGNLLQGLFDDKKDIDKECGYPRVLNEFHYRDMYDREGIATRVVDIMPDECFVMPPEIKENEEAQKTPFEQAWYKLNRKHRIMHYAHRGDKLSGIGSFGIIFMGLSGNRPIDQSADGINDKGEPSKTRPTNQEILFLRAFDQTQVRVREYETDTNNPRFGQPKSYQINFFDPRNITTGESGVIGATSKWSDVHWSRVIHLADNRGDSEVHGRPRMKNTYNRLCDLRKILSGSGEMYWKGAFPGYSFEVNPDIASDADPIDRQSIRDEFERYSSGLQRYLAITGVSAKSLAPQVADPTHHVSVQILGISISLGVPQRMFMGSEEARLSSTEDTKIWNKKLTRRQEDYLTPYVIRNIIDRLILLGILPTPADDYIVSWPDLNTMTDADKSNISVERTTALVQYVSGMVESVVAPKEFLTVILGFTDAQADVIIKEAKANLASSDGNGMTALKDQRAAMKAKGQVNPSGNSKLKSSKTSPKKVQDTQSVGTGGA